MKQKRYRTPILFAYLGIGSILLLVARSYQQKIPDFVLGLLEGLSITLIIVGASHLIWYLFTKRHPLTGDPGKQDFIS